VRPDQFAKCFESKVFYRGDPLVPFNFTIWSRLLFSREIRPITDFLSLLRAFRL
jgi:hypothetical protein